MKKTDYPLLFLAFFIYVISFDLQAKSSLSSKALNNTTIEITKNSNQVILAHLKSTIFTDRLVAKFKLPIEGWRGE